MRVFLAALVAVAIAVMLYVAPSISSSTAEPGAPYALEIECPAPGVAEAEQFACASCSHADVCTHYARFVETEIVRDHSICAADETHCGASFANECIYGNCKHEATAFLEDGYPLKMPSHAVVLIEDSGLRLCNANAADCVEVEVLGVGV